MPAKNEENNPLPDVLQIVLDENKRRVRTKDYIAAKTKQLREFGYRNLSEDDVRAELKLILAGVRNIGGNGGLSVIGGFMVDDITEEQ